MEPKKRTGNWTPDGKAEFASYENLVSLKEHAGRPQDLIDLQRLREARGEE